jgi:hypothetical protein
VKKFSTKRAAALGMTSALALGTVVAAGVEAPADAASASSSYNCTLTAPIGTVPLAVAGSLSLPSTVQAGQNLGGRAVTMNVTMPKPLVDGLLAALAATQIGAPSAIGGQSTDVTFPVAGTSAIPAGTLAAPQAGPAADGSLTIAGAGKTLAHRAPLTPGSYVLSMPGDFSFTPYGTFGSLGVQPMGAPVPCHTDAPASLGTMKVVKATSSTSAKLANAPVTRAKHGKIATVVKAAGYAAKGTVVAKEGTHTLKAATLKGGKATLVLPLLKKGAHTITVLYKGNASAKSSSKTLRFTVK